MTELHWEAAGEQLMSARAGDVAVLRFDRPEKLNALTPAMLPAIAALIRTLAAGAGGLVITGTGRAFSAGDDLDATADLDSAGFGDLIDGFQDMTRAILQTQVPVVAALNGLAVGGAAELSLACDARIGRADTTFYFPENGIGLTISNGSTYLLPRILGGNALPLILEGGRIDAVEALRSGLLTEIVDDPLARSVDMVQSWASPSKATRSHLKLLRPDPAEVEAAMARETAAAYEVFSAGIVTAGAEAFRARRS
jgi:enoyl-CoA hydratase